LTRLVEQLSFPIEELAALAVNPFFRARLAISAVRSEASRPGWTKMAWLGLQAELPASRLLRLKNSEIREQP
jgi:hypothetical protein